MIDPETKKPVWLHWLGARDFLMDGHPIKGDVDLERWNGLDWTSVYPDMGPSPSGNIGPYFRVFYPKEGTVHRIYPKIPMKWARFLFDFFFQYKTLNLFAGNKHRPIVKTCSLCEMVFYSKRNRTSRKFCSNACRSKAYRRRKKRSIKHE